MHPTGRRDRLRASSLIIVIAMLSVLAILSISFARIMVVERDATRSHVDQVRARFLAQSGVEHGLARLEAILQDRPYLTSEDAYAWPGDRGDALDTAPSVSFEGGTTPTGYPYSGWIAPIGAGSGRYDDRGLHYVLKIYDLGSLAYVGRMEAGGNGNTRLLNNLGRLRRAAGIFTRLDGSAGTELANRMPSVGYQNFEDVVRALTAAYGESAGLTADLRILRDLITFYGPGDPKTVRPGPGLVQRITDPQDARASRPLSLNTAPYELIEALLAGLQATWTDANGAVVVHTVTDARATALASAIIDERDDYAPADKDPGKKDPFFYSYSDFEQFLVRSVKDAVIDVRDAGVILAMVNPNGRLLRFNPDTRLRYLSSKADKFGHTERKERNDDRRLYADKSRLTQWTTEGCFDGRGAFRIESLGRIVATDGSILAQQRVEAIVRLERRVTWTTQADFESLLATGPDQYVQTYPESLPSNGAAHGASDATGGLRLGPNNALPPGSVLGGLRTGDGAAYTPAGHSTSPAPWNPINTGSLMSGAGDRASDGLLADPTRQRVIAYDGGNMPAAQGTLGFWVKLDEPGLHKSGGMLWATTDMPEAVATSNPDHDEGINTTVYYRWDPVAHRGYVHIARTYFFLKNGVPGTGTAAGLKWEITGKLKSNAFEILKEEGRRLIQPSLDQMGWSQDIQEQWRQVFGQWFAERVMSALTGGEFNSKIVGIGHAVIEDIQNLPVMCSRWSSENLQNIYPKIFEGEVSAQNREWVSAAFHTVVNETDKYQYSYNTFAVNPGDYGSYYMQNIVDPVDGQTKKRWQALKNYYQKILLHGAQLPYAASRVEIVKEVYKEDLKSGVWVPSDKEKMWRPGEWHHVQAAWWGTTGYMKAYFDGKDDYDTIDEWGPLNIWSTRMRSVRNRIYFGPYILDRASNDAGNTGAADRDLYWFTNATVDRLVVRNLNAAGSPEQDRYYTEPSINPNALLLGGYAQFALPLRTQLGGVLDRARGAWIDWTDYVPASKDGDPYVEAKVYVKNGGLWIQASRIAEGSNVTLISNDLRSALLETSLPDNLDVLIVFEDTGEKRENPADALDVTPFVDDLSIKILTGPEIVQWTWVP